MMNFWISLYVTIVIVVSGSIVIGSDGISERVQISRIGSEFDQKIPQDQPQTNFNKSPHKSDLVGPHEQ